MYVRRVKVSAAALTHMHMPAVRHCRRGRCCDVPPPPPDPPWLDLIAELVGSTEGSKAGASEDCQLPDCCANKGPSKSTGTGTAPLRCQGEGEVKGGLRGTGLGATYPIATRPASNTPSRCASTLQGSRILNSLLGALLLVKVAASTSHPVPQALPPPIIAPGSPSPT